LINWLEMTCGGRAESKISYNRRDVFRGVASRVGRNLLLDIGAPQREKDCSDPGSRNAPAYSPYVG
jgi:hypothetical protein